MRVLRNCHQTKDAHRESTVSGKTQALTKSMNMDMWATGILNQLLSEVFILELNVQKK